MQFPPITQRQAEYGVTYDAGWDFFKVTRHDAVAAGIKWFEEGWNKFTGDVVPTHTGKILGPDKTIEAFSNGVHYGSLSAYITDPDVALFVRRPVKWDMTMAAAFVADAQEMEARHLGYNYFLIGTMALSRTRFGAVMDFLTRKHFSHWVDSLADSHTRVVCSTAVALLNNMRPQLCNLGCLSWDADQEEVKPSDLFTDKLIYEPWATELLP